MIQKDKWRVTLLSWEHYRALMLEGVEAKKWKFLVSEADLIVGGLNYSGNFMYVVQTTSFQHFLTIL